MTLACPQEKHLLEIKSAMFGRTTSESRLCLRPGNLNPDRSESVKCESDVTMKVAELCADQFPCVFNVNNLTFPDPCPDVYKYMWVLFECRKLNFFIHVVVLLLKCVDILSYRFAQEMEKIFSIQKIFEGL